MRTTTLVSLICIAGAVAGCDTQPGHTVEFVASNPNSVLLDFRARPPGELPFANGAATQQCQLISDRSAVLESLNVRDDSTIRATYLCRGGTQSAAAVTNTRRRQ